MTMPATLLSKTEFRIHPATRPGHVHHTVANLTRLVEFYRNVIGLTLHWREGDTAGLGVGKDDLLQLTEVRVVSL
jgi:catechol-2,3-dioxygenase